MATANRNARLSTYLNDLCSVLGHADRAAGLRGYCSGLMLPLDRKSVGPKVRRAAGQAQVSEFVEANRQGYATRVGERGIQLSGGQRQRIGIARALYKEASVLVFDEASSALDMATEAAVMRAVQALDPDLTVFLIAHRVQTLRDCDIVIRLEGGRLVHLGTYSDAVGSDDVRKESSQKSPFEA